MSGLIRLRDINLVFQFLKVQPKGNFCEQDQSTFLVLWKVGSIFNCEFIRRYDFNWPGFVSVYFIHAFHFMDANEIPSLKVMLLLLDNLNDSWITQWDVFNIIGERLFSVLIKNLKPGAEVVKDESVQPSRQAPN